MAREHEANVKAFLRSRNPWDREILNLVRVEERPWGEVLAELQRQGYPHKLSRIAVGGRLKRLLADLKAHLRGVRKAGASKRVP